MRAWKLLLLLVILFSAAPASAQVSIWLQRGTSGFGANAGATLSDNTQTVYTGGGYSYKGWADVDLTLKYTTLDNPTDENGEEIPFDLSSLAISPTLQVHPLKQSKTVPISIGLSVGLEFGSLQSDNFVDGASGRTFAYGFSANAYRFFKLSDHVGIIPAAGAFYNHAKVTFEDPDGNEESSDGNTIGLSTAAYIGYIDDGGRIWGVVPTIAFYHPTEEEGGDDFVEFGVSVGLIFSQAPKEE